MDEFTPEEKGFMERNLACPFCGSNQVSEGPSGGLSQNLYCKGTYTSTELHGDEPDHERPCGARFNSTPFGMELIQRSQIPPDDYAWKVGKKAPTKPEPKRMTGNDFLAEFGLAEKKKRWYAPWRQA